MVNMQRELTVVKNVLSAIFVNAGQREESGIIDDQHPSVPRSYASAVADGIPALPPRLIAEL